MTAARGVNPLLDEASWRKQSPYSWTAGPFTICAVRMRGEVAYELWRNSAFCCRAEDAQTLRNVAASGGAVA